MNELTLVLIAIAVIVFYLIRTYNRFIKRRNQVQEAWSGIDVQLKRRHSLIPNLVETVKGYGRHERDALKEVTELRTAVGGLRGLKERSSAESHLSQTIGSLIAVAEDYPDLKASENFQALQKDLSEIEDAIQNARRYYNGAVRLFNTLVQSFPSNLIARWFSFTEAAYFEIELATQRTEPEVRF